jgi:hypothetical protein
MIQEQVLPAAERKLALAEAAVRAPSAVAHMQLNSLCLPQQVMVLCFRHEIREEIGSSRESMVVHLGVEDPDFVG